MERHMDGIARDSRATYRALVYDDPQFVQYFQLATPIDVIQRMEISSRPPRDQAAIRTTRSSSCVRFPGCSRGRRAAICCPAGTAWARHSNGGERHGTALDDMMRDWPFLRALIDDVEMVLATADLAIAVRYARLAGKLGDQYFPVIRAEFDRTVAQVLGLKHEKARSTPTLRCSGRFCYAIRT